MNFEQIIEEIRVLDLDCFSYSDTTLKSLRDDKPWRNENTVKKRNIDTTSVRVGF